MKIKFYYSRKKDTADKICGFVYAVDCDDYYCINEQQFYRAIEKTSQKTGDSEELIWWQGLNFYDKEYKLVEQWFFNEESKPLLVDFDKFLQAE